jgi:CheY-like chemotaxis protein
MADICVRSADAPVDPFWSAVARGSAQASHVRLTAVLAFIPAAVLLLGWACDIALLKAGLPGQGVAGPSSALCFTLCAVSLGLSMERCALCGILRQVGAVTALLVVAATVWWSAADVDWATSVALGLLCVCLLLTEARGETARACYAWFATVGMLFATTVVLAYAYGLQAVYTLGVHTPVAFASGWELTVLFFGLLLRRPDVGWVRVLADASIGAASARRLLLWAGMLLAVLSAIVKMGTAAGPGTGFEVTLLTVGGLGLLLAALLTHARQLNALETIRHNVITDLRAAETQLVRAAHDKDRHLSMLAHELRNPLMPLRNGIEIVRQSSGENPALSRTLEMMSRQVMQMVRLVDGLVGTEVALREAPVAGPESGGFSPLRILIADDNVDGADSLALLLQGDGHVVLTAINGRQAIEVAEAFRPDVILMDIAMPNLDGLEATREIRRRSWGGRVRIIALTAWDQDSERRRTHAAGMNDHLVKPVDPLTLAAVLRAGGYSRERT